MCFGFKKKIAKLQASVDELTKIIKTRELVKLRRDSKELGELKELISHIKFKVKEVRAFEGEGISDSDKDVVRIIYQLPVIGLTIDDEGNPEKNDFFYATNMLDMISIEDMKKIQKVLNEEKNKKR